MERRMALYHCTHQKADLCVAQEADGGETKEKGRVIGIPSWPAGDGEDKDWEAGRAADRSRALLKG